MDSQKVNLKNLNAGYLPPQATDLERAVLGAVILDKEAIYEVVDLLTADMFYKLEHKNIYEAIIELYDTGSNIDLLLIVEKLKSNGTLEQSGGAYYVSQLVNDVASSAHIAEHAKVIAEAYIKRQAIKVSHETISKGYSDSTDPFVLIDTAVKELSDITKFRNIKQTKSVFEGALKVVEETETIRRSDNAIVGVPTGFFDLDYILGGLRKTDLIIVAGRPAMGKTAFMCSLARNTARLGRSCGVISLEMPTEQISARILSMQSRINLMKLRNGKYNDIEFDHVTKVMDELKKFPLYIDDSISVSLLHLRTIIRNLVVNNKCELVIIDQLNHIHYSEKGRSRNDEVGTITRTLKSLAREYEVPIVLLHQLSRKVEERADKIPQLADLRDSGNIEQDADIVMFLHRPEYYFDSEEVKGIGEVIVAKHRNGEIGSIQLKFNKQYTEFVDLNAYSVHASNFENE